MVQSQTPLISSIYNPYCTLCPPAQHDSSSNVTLSVSCHHRGTTVFGLGRPTAWTGSQFQTPEEAETLSPYTLPAGRSWPLSSQRIDQHSQLVDESRHTASTAMPFARAPADGSTLLQNRRPSASSSIIPSRPAQYPPMPLQSRRRDGDFELLDSISADFRFLRVDQTGDRSSRRSERSRSPPRSWTRPNPRPRSPIGYRYRSGRAMLEHWPDPPEPMLSREERQARLEQPPLWAQPRPYEDVAPPSSPHPAFARLRTINQAFPPEVRQVEPEQPIVRTPGEEASQPSNWDAYISGFGVHNSYRSTDLNSNIAEMGNALQGFSIGENVPSLDEDASACDLSGEEDMQMDGKGV